MASRLHSTRWIGASYVFDLARMVRTVGAVGRWQRIFGVSELKALGSGARTWSSFPHQPPENSVRDGGSIGGTARISGASRPALFHRQVDASVREGHKRETRGLRKEALWIPSCVQGRGKLPDLQIKVLLAPIQEDFFSGLFAIQKLGKNKWSGPLYQLRFIQEEHAEEEKLGESQVLVNPLPVETIRVKAHNMMLNPITEAVKTIAFLYCPENEPVRVRVPIKYINEEKCPGLREGGWLNRVQQCVDINVAPFTEPPLFATQDVGGMGLKDRKTIGDLKFKGKGNACVAVLPPDTMATIISKI